MSDDVQAQARQTRDRIRYRCPSCGNETLIIDSIGHVVCGWLKCTHPTAFSDLIDAAFVSPRPAIEQVLRDAQEIRSACGFMWMRMAVAKDAQDAYEVAKREFETHEAAFKRLETSLPKLLLGGVR